MTTVLLVDDDAALRDTFAEAIGLTGMKVLTAADGERALAMLDANRFDVVVTDLFMPNMDGIELIISLKKLHPDVPVLLMTGGLNDHSGRASDPTEPCLAAARALGAVRTLRKPVLPSQLVDEINAQVAVSDAVTA